MPYRIPRAFIAPPAAASPNNNHRNPSNNNNHDYEPFVSRPYHHHHQHHHHRARNHPSVDSPTSPIPLMSATPARWARLLKSLSLFRRLASVSAFSSMSSTTSAPFTLALCMTSVEHVPNLFCPESDLDSDSVYISLEGPAVAGAAHRTPTAHVDARSRCAVFSDRDPAVVVRVSDALTTRLALRCSTTGTLLGDARIDVRALAARGTACRLRVPMTMTGVAKRYGGLHHGQTSYRATVTCLALAVRGRSPEDETSWDARPHYKASNKNGAADRRMMESRRDQPSHLAMHQHAYGSPENPSATVVDVRRRLRSALVADRCEMQEEGGEEEDEPSVFTDGDDVDVYEMDDIDDEDTLRQLTANTDQQDKWSDVDAVTDIDEVSLADLSSVFLTVDTARPVAHDHMLESAGLEWYKRPTSRRSLSGIDESVVTKGPIEYL